MLLYPYVSKPIQDKNIEVPDNMLKKLLTPSEIRMLKNRWQIIQSLGTGHSIRKVAEEVNVGTDTVVRVIRMMENGDLKKYLISEKKSTRQIKTQTPWIFGKNN